MVAYFLLPATRYSNIYIYIRIEKEHCHVKINWFFFLNKRYSQAPH